MLGFSGVTTAGVVLFVLPIALTFMMFRREHMPWWWPWALTAICFVLGFGIVHELYIADPIGLRSVFGLPKNTDPLGFRAVVGLESDHNNEN